MSGQIRNENAQSLQGERPREVRHDGLVRREAVKQDYRACARVIRYAGFLDDVQGHPARARVDVIAPFGESGRACKCEERAKEEKQNSSCGNYTRGPLHAARRLRERPARAA